MRLQDTYKLDTASIARGQLNGVQYSTEMSANDCFELGRQSYLNKDFYHTALWMHEAINRLSAAAAANETDVSEQAQHTTRADILEYLAFSVYKQGNVLNALQMTNELLLLRPDHERALGNKVYYEKEMQTVRQVGLENDRMRGDDGSSQLDLKVRQHMQFIVGSMFFYVCFSMVRRRSPMAIRTDTRRPSACSTSGSVATKSVAPAPSWHRCAAAT